MSDIFEGDIEENNNFELDSLDDNIAPDGQDFSQAQYNNFGQPLTALRLEYSKENLYAKNERKLDFHKGDYVIVQTRYGRDAARVLGPCGRPYGVRTSEIINIERICDEIDLAHIKENESMESDAREVFCERVKAHNLSMKLITVHFVLEEQKVLFFFSAENRVDFRLLVRDLVSVFKARIELRQIGSRDEARIIGGLGMCGRPFCCHAMSDKLRPVSIKMAKDQNLSLNSSKISGSCGRLLCCLSHEDNFYFEARKKLPNEGTKIFYDGTDFKITEINVLTSMAKMAGSDGRFLTVNTKRFERTGSQWHLRSSINNDDNVSSSDERDYNENYEDSINIPPNTSPPEGNK